MLEPRRNANGYPNLRFSKGSDPKLTGFGTKNGFRLIIRIGTENYIRFRFLSGLKQEPLGSDPWTQFRLNSSSHKTYKTCHVTHLPFKYNKKEKKKKHVTHLPFRYNKKKEKEKTQLDFPCRSLSLLLSQKVYAVYIYGSSCQSPNSISLPH